MTDQQLTEDGQVWDQWFLQHGHRIIASRADTIDGPTWQESAAADLRTLEHELRKPLEGERALDIGCGLGRLTRHLAGAFGEVIALDISPQILGRCQERLADLDNVRYILGGADALTAISSSSIDCVISVCTFQHITSVREITAYLHQVGRLMTDNTGAAAIQLRRNSLRRMSRDAAVATGRIMARRLPVSPPNLQLPSLERQWRGARIRTEVLRELAKQHPDVQETRLSHYPMHSWLLLRA